MNWIVPDLDFDFEPCPAASVDYAVETGSAAQAGFPGEPVQLAATLLYDDAALD